MPTVILLTDLAHATPETDHAAPDALGRRVIEQIRAAPPDSRRVGNDAGGQHHG